MACLLILLFANKKLSLLLLKSWGATVVSEMVSGSKTWRLIQRQLRTGMGCENVSNLALWFNRFKLYAQHGGVPMEKWVEIHSVPFRVVG